MRISSLELLSPRDLTPFLIRVYQEFFPSFSSLESNDEGSSGCIKTNNSNSRLHGFAASDSATKMKMATRCVRHLSQRSQLLRRQWQQPLPMSFANLTIGTRYQSTESATAAPQSSHTAVSEALMLFDDAKNPYLGLGDVRRTPVSASYFSRETNFNDIYIRLLKLYHKHHHLPTLPQSEAPPRVWKRFKEIRAHMGEKVKASHISNALKVAKRLHLIEPSIAPPQLEIALEPFTRAGANIIKEVRQLTPDAYGRICAGGSRKSATARAYVVEGTGEVMVNGKSLAEAFGRVHDRESAVWALTATKRLDKYNVWVVAEGGGPTGQAESITLAIAKALMAFEPALKPALRKGKRLRASTDVMKLVLYFQKANFFPPSYSWLRHTRPPKG